MENLKKFDREEFCDDHGYDELIFLDVIFDAAIVGVSTNSNIMYNGMYMVELLMTDNLELSWIDAMEHYNHNLVNGLLNSDSVNKQPILIDLN